MKHRSLLFLMIFIYLGATPVFAQVKGLPKKQKQEQTKPKPKQEQPKPNPEAKIKPQPPNENQKEEDFWSFTRDIDTKEAYESFLSKYPNSKYLSEAEQKIAELSKPKIDPKYLPEVVYVEGGTFTMGCRERGSFCSDDEKPAHQVTVSSFSIGKYPVTVEEYRYYCIQTGIIMPDAPSWGWHDDHPMVYVNWNDTQGYVNWLSRETGKNYRLPTEAEWEFAARGGNQSRDYNYSGSNTIDEAAWYGKERAGQRTHSVGGKKGNELSLYDMSGNVWEWCQDWYGEDYYNNSPSINPKGPSSGFSRVLRGGNWFDGTTYCLVAHRHTSHPGNRSDDRGFRIVLSR
ncbi:SUMF1/EgtB/PvdO family nonheme iron enzyme [Patescibacteria group bacterium]|nr:SUMF1/EgtB/PvdO family nonheme iron enzyme [Patescibacteria group bacterium]